MKVLFGNPKLPLAKRAADFPQKPDAEADIALPETEKLLILGKTFQVSMDVLLKDELTLSEVLFGNPKLPLAKRAADFPQKPDAVSELPHSAIGDMSSPKLHIPAISTLLIISISYIKTNCH